MDTIDSSDQCDQTFNDSINLTINQVLSQFILSEEVKHLEKNAGSGFHCLYLSLTEKECNKSGLCTSGSKVDFILFKVYKQTTHASLALNFLSINLKSYSLVVSSIIGVSYKVFTNNKQ